MKKIEEAIDRIRTLECPTGDLENRVAGILEDYGFTQDKLNVDRDKSLDSGEAQAYRLNLADEGRSFVVLASSGYDDYVTKVLDVRSIH